jgi:hypothetical protein
MSVILQEQFLRAFNEDWSDWYEEPWPDTYREDKYSLVGQDGNAFALMGYTARCMRECGLRNEIKKMQEEAMSGDYNNLIRVCNDYVQRCNEIACNDHNSIDESYIKNKKHLKESMKEIDRKYFTSLNKEEDGHYYILKDGNYVKDFYADSDTDAKKKFQQYLKKNESLKGSLTEAHWNYTLKCGTDLRKAIEDGNAEEVINQLWNGYKELLKADIIDDRDYESYTEDLIDSEYWEKDELEDNIDWALDNFYDLCDNARVWISLNEHFVTTPEYNDACVDIHRQMVAGKISKEEAAEKFRQMDTLLDESHPVTESLWDIVKGYLEEDL